ncbi:hypothetical protein Tco_1274780 [Tanacetum coccineum]
MSKVLQERGSESLPGSTKTNPRDHVKSISTTIEADTPSIRRIESEQYAVLDLQNKTQFFKPNQSTIPFPSRLTNDYYKEMNVLDSGLGNLAPTKLTVELANRTIKLPKGVAQNVLVGIGLREIMDPDLEARLMGKTLMLNRSQDPDFGDYIKLNDLNEPLEFGRNQVDDLGPTIEGGEVIGTPMIDIIETRNDDERIKGITRYPSLCYYDRKILVENMDPYRDQEIGDVIVGEPFCREICVKARRKLLTGRQPEDLFSVVESGFHSSHVADTAYPTSMYMAYLLSKSQGSFSF